MKKFRSYFEAASAGFFLPSPNFEIWKIIILKFQSSKFKVQNSRNYTGWLHYPTWGGAEVPVTCWMFWCYMYWRRSIAKIFRINHYSLPFFPGICQSPVIRVHNCDIWLPLWGFPFVGDHLGILCVCEVWSQIDTCDFFFRSVEVNPMRQVNLLN